MRLVAFRDFKFREKVDCHGNIEYQFKASHIIFSKPIQMKNNFKLLPFFDKDLNKPLSRSDLTFFYKLIKPKGNLDSVKISDKDQLKCLIELWKKGYYVIVQKCS